MKLYIVRHGETIGNVKEITQGWLPGKLSKTGERQAKKLAERLSKEAIDIIYCSDLRRCRQTIKPLLELREGIPIHYVKELRERNWGIFEGKKHKEVNKWMDKNKMDFDNDRLPEGESFFDVQKRMAKFFRKIYLINKGKNVLFVTHGMAKRSLITFLLNKNKEKREKKFRSPNTALSIIQINDKGKHKAKLINSTEHLGEMLTVVNFKNYKKGKKVLELAWKIERYLPKSIVAIPSLNIEEVSEKKKTRLMVFAQHVSSKNSERATGFLTAEAIKSAGAKGTLLNHSEHRISFEEIKETMKLCKKLDLEVILCAANLKEVSEFKKLKPYAIAFEDPKLISTGKSITKYNPESVKKFAEELKKTDIVPLCGAGINSVEDVLKARELGCKGVLIASAIAKSKNPDKLLKEISQI